MDVRKIIARLAEDRETELTQYELNTLLEQEISKAESEIDTALVEEILKTLEESPSAQEKSTAWQAIERKTQRKKGWMNLTTARRIVACLLVLITISALSVGSAYAFNWTFLLKLLKPLAESFGIYSANTPGQTSCMMMKTPGMSRFSTIPWRKCQSSGTVLGCCPHGCPSALPSSRAPCMKTTARRFSRQLIWVKTIFSV